MVAIAVFVALLALVAASVLLAVVVSAWWWLLAGPAILLLVLGIIDITQRERAILRNFPVIGRGRYLMETIRPMIQQYFVERNYDGKPFDRDVRLLVYERAAGTHSVKSFGTELEVRSPGYEYLVHSVQPGRIPEGEHRVRLGGPQCTLPYDASLLNISAMSFGSLSKNAVLAMNRGAAKGGFLHDTGEGGLTKYHLGAGADLLWEFGSGYFGCRDADGNFSPEEFAAKARLDEVSAVSIKLSQGAKPGLGGVLPGDKVTPEIAEARGVPVGMDCISPPGHSAFGTPTEMMEFIAQLRELSGGKPIGFKLCVGMRRDFLALCKAMLATGILPDFIIVDGAEGGTGAAPLEYEDHMGTPLAEGLHIVHNALMGCGLREHIRIGAAGKIASGHDIVRLLIQGADFCMSARAMMMAVGCIQAQKCHTNHCPTGVATQDPKLARGLDVPSKSEQVYNYHRATIEETKQMLSTLGVSGPEELDLRMLRRRISQTEVVTYQTLYNWLRHGELLSDPPRGWAADWNAASADRFGPDPRLRGARYSPDRNRDGIPDVGLDDAPVGTSGSPIEGRDIIQDSPDDGSYHA
ncbi:FMN-binding glutamate synthase family protein [Brevibacterium sp. R8603A2]|uniref:FMN-binding glutamate synthase family protein n=1 Tax=Brevibacterium sp. R8603A2 TaxID=2929779 RepID=UPI001FFBED92|nr:FMN-binding glutamate synthase family protein [Brevibacterium sp. R8603A2]MCK1801692.1 FMN-binding glutamate synthase family protein [Brevibacterium sp. R8603A2]